MQVGDVFDFGPERYQIVERKGEGGFSIVFRAACQSGPSADLAVKVLQPQYANDPPWRQRFEREARILANIAHPNVVRIRATWPQADGSLAIIQEYVADARDMTEWFQLHASEEHLSIALQVLYGLRATHGTAPASGAVHRDLSPGNVLVSPDGLARIIDFGLSKQHPRGSTVITVGYSFGTPGCIAPEQVANAATVDHRADFYALGRSLAASLQSRNPQHVDCALLQTPWREFCTALTAHDAGARYQFANDAIRDLLFRAEAAGLLPARMDIHLAEFSTFWPTMPSEWSRVVRKYLSTSRASSYELFSALEHVTEPMLRHTAFDADTLFPILDQRIFEPIFGSGLASFASTDRLGRLIQRHFPHLSHAHKVVAFRRLCRTAVAYHRYYLMGVVRELFRSEIDGTLRGSLLAVLNQEDPGAFIEGRGDIPGR